MPPSFRTPTRKSGAKWQGVKYERKVQAHLVAKYATYVPSLWFLYYTEGLSRVRWCQPDGLHFDFKKGIITIVEVKYCHTPDAYFQLKELYLPVVQAAFGTELWEYRLLEWVRWYDPVVNFPGRHFLRPELELVKDNEIGVKIWSPTRNK